MTYTSQKAYFQEKPTGSAGASLVVIYRTGESTPQKPEGVTPEGWDTKIPTTVKEDEWVYMSQRMSNETSWSTPIQISAHDGDPGKDGPDIKYIYHRSNVPITDWTGKGPNANGGFGYSTSLKDPWKESPQGVTENYQYEYVSMATKPAGTGTNWGDFSNPPVIWSKWGEKGQDGDGVYYHYCRMTTEEEPLYPAPDDAGYSWTNDPQGVSKEYPYEYVVAVAASEIIVNARKINTAERNFPLADWERYGTIGHIENWTINDVNNLNNSHIVLGDYAYVSGTVQGSTIPVKLYGKVLELHDASVFNGYIKMRTLRLDVGVDTSPTAVLWAKYSATKENLLKDKDITVNSGDIVRNHLRYTVSGKSWTTGLALGRPFEVGEQYVISYRFKLKNWAIPNNGRFSIGGHSYSFEFNKIILDGQEISSPNYANGISIEQTCDPHFIQIYAKHIEFTTDNGAKDPTPTLYIQPLRGHKDSGDVSVEFEVWDIMVTQGNEYTPWTPAPEDAGKVGQLSGVNLIKQVESTYNQNTQNYFVIGDAPPIYLGCEIAIESGILTIASESIKNNSEIYYRFIDPTKGSDKLYSVEAGGMYAFSGYVKCTTSKDQLIHPYVTIRHEEKTPTNSSWHNDTRTTILKDDSEIWVPFREVFIISENATGFYLSFQIYHDIRQDDTEEYSGTFDFKDLRLEKIVDAPNLEEKFVDLREQVKKLAISGDSIAIYDRNKTGNLTLSDFSILAGREIVNGQIGAEYKNAVYLAGWDVTSSGIIKKEDGILKTGLLGGDVYRAISAIDNVARAVRLISGVTQSGGTEFMWKCIAFQLPGSSESGEDYPRDIILDLGGGRYFRLTGASYGDYYWITPENKVLKLIGGAVEIQPSENRYWDWLDQKAFDELEESTYEQLNWQYEHVYVTNHKRANTILLEDGSFYTSAGRIGGWNIQPEKLLYPAPPSTSGGVQLPDSEIKYGTGMAATGSQNDPAFYAGFKNIGYTDPWSEPNGVDWTDHTNFYVTNKGYLFSNLGEIGGWEIAELRPNNPIGKGFIKRNKETQRTLGMAGLGDGQSVAIWVGCTGTPWENSHYEQSTPFYVLESGEVYCNNLKIGGGEISSINCGNVIIQKINNSTSQISATQELKIGGNGAYITFKQGGSSQTNYRIKLNAYQTQWEVSQWYYYLSCEDNNNQRIASPENYSVTLYGKRYRDGKERWDGQVCSLTLAVGSSQGASVSSSFTTGFGEDYVLIYTTSDYSGSYIKCITDTKVTNSETLQLSEGTLNNATHYMYCDIDLVPKIATTSGGCSLGRSGEEWFNIRCINLYRQSETSDIRVKNSLEQLDQRYEKFFDSMAPTRYKYNEGTSDRYHTGFIAQWLVENLEMAGLTTKDFAGVVLDNPGTEHECWYLRRDEFVALNTWQIQKLKPRVSSLEQTILDYETRISTLEQQVQSLTS